MKMMQKMSLLALAACAAGAVVSTPAKAEDRSWGTAGAKVTVNALQAWKIEKAQEGDVKLNDAGRIDAAATLVTFKITNGMDTASSYSIAPSGSSADGDGKFVAYATDDGDVSETFSIVPEEGTELLAFDGTAKKYRANTSVTAGGSQTVRFRVADTAKVISPGDYTVSVELFTPAA
ncbi:hypothetical protein ACSN7O_004821 [Enterobacter chuandaensis]